MKAQLLKLKSDWKLNEIVQVAEDYLSKGSYDKEIVLELINACWHLADFKRLEKYAMLLLDNNDYLNIAKKMLVYAYARTSKLDEVREIVKGYSNCFDSYERQMLINKIFKTPEEKQGLTNNLLWSSFHNLLYVIQLKSGVIYNGLVIEDSNLSLHERITILRKALAIYTLMYEEEDFNDEAIMVMDIHVALAILHFRNQSKDGGYYHLEEALKMCKLFMNYQESELHKSLFVRNIKNEPRSKWSQSAIKSLQDNLESEYFLKIRNEERFINLISKVNSL